MNNIYHSNYDTTDGHEQPIYPIKMTGIFASVTNSGEGKSGLGHKLDMRHKLGIHNAIE